MEDRDTTSTIEQTGGRRLRHVVESALNLVSRAPSIPSNNVDGLLTEINAAKEAHQVLCSLFTKGVSTSVPLLMHMAKWGEPTRYSYNRSFDISSMNTSRTLLAMLIAERFLLAKHRGYLKHVTVSIVGISGSGKTTYSVASIAGAMLATGYSREEALETASQLTFFEPGRFVEYVKHLLDERIWVPAILLDDVGAQISKYWLWLGERWWAHLFSVLDHLKDWCGAFIMTASSFSTIPARLRDKIDLVVEASEVMYEGYIFNIMLWYRRDKYFGTTRREPLFIDVFPPTVMMHSGMWQRMMEERRMVGLKRIGVVIDALRKMEEESGGQPRQAKG